MSDNWWEKYQITLDGASGSGAERYTTCPECSPKRRKAASKCLSVNTEKRVFNCHHCGWTGSDKGVQRAGSKPHFDLPDEIERPIDEEVGLRMLRERGITMKVIRRNKITSAKVWMPQENREVDAIAFPYYRGGRLVNRKWRQIDAKNFRLESNAERVLYKQDDIAATTIITEGEMDALSLECAGFEHAISVPDGAPAVNTKNYQTKFSYLEQAEAALAGVREFLIAVDMDAPGEKLSEELSRRLGRHRCKRVTWPDGCKDANETWMRFGVEGIREAIDAATDYPVKGVHQILDLGDRVTPLYNRGLLPGRSTGWPSLDGNYTVRPGEITVVTGIPSHGKSTWVDNLMLNLIRRNGWQFMVFSPENLPLEHYTARLCEKWLGRPFFGSYNAVPRMTQPELDGALAQLHEYISFILDADGEEDMTLDWILGRAGEYLLRRGVQGLIIDPWNEVEHQRPSNLTETEYVGQSLTRIRRFARKNGIHVWIVAHPTKLQKDGSGSYPVPTPYNINGGANWFNKSDNCVAVWRDLKTLARETQIHVQKIRFKEVGVIGRVDLEYYHFAGIYRDLPAYATGTKQTTP